MVATGILLIVVGMLWLFIAANNTRPPLVADDSRDELPRKRLHFAAAACGCITLVVGVLLVVTAER
jgi:hypothetical protein